MMDDKKYDPIALREVYIILERLNMLKEISPSFIEYMKNEQDATHEFSFNEKKPLLEQIPNEKTKVLLAYLVERYISKKQ